jgi:hypothetical protein
MFTRPPTLAKNINAIAPVTRRAPPRVVLECSPINGEATTPDEINTTVQALSGIAAILRAADPTDKA